MTMRNQIRPGIVGAVLSTVLSIVLAMLGSTSSHAQTLNVYNVNVSAYPTITANYVVFDSNGDPVTGLKASDFRITETPQGGVGVDLTATLTQDCEPLATDPEASILIVLDRSNSMRDIVGSIPRFKYAQQAIASFVNRIKFSGETRVCFTTFAGTFEIAAPWTNNPKNVTDTLNKMEPQTVTNYVLPFEGPPTTIYDLFKQRPPNIPRYVFFLTDGHPNPSIPNEDKFINKHKTLLQQNGIRFFAVTILQSYTHASLETFASATGGKAIVTTEDKLVSLFDFLALETQEREVCTISWISPFVCREEQRNRTAEIRMVKGTPLTATVNYTTPPASVAGATVSAPVLFCGDPPPNQPAAPVPVVLTANGGPLNITAGTVVPTGNFSVVDWGGGTGSTFAPFTLLPGQSRTIRVQFTQGATQIFRQAQLQFTGTPCPPVVDLVGGQGMILLIKPNGGELYSTCDSIDITWSGVVPTQPVTIEYSADGGSTWNLISNNATGLRYKWVAPAAGVNYKVRVSVAPAPQYQWVSTNGGTSADSATSVAISPNDLHVYTTGFYNGPTAFPTKPTPTTTSNLAGDVDGYLAEWDSNGGLQKVTLLTGTGSSTEKVVGVVTDKNGNYYVAGYYTGATSKFGSLPLALPGGDVSNMFIYAFDQNGALIWGNKGQGDGLTNCNANATGIGIRYDVSGNPQIVVQGKFSRYMRVGNTSTGTWAESLKYANNTMRDYYAIYTASGTATFSLGVPPSTFTMQKMSVNDSRGFTYDVGSFTGSKTWAPPTISKASAGASDAFLSKFGSTPASSDVSENSFSVKSPQLTFNQGNGVFDPTAQGQSTPKSFSGVLCNTGDFDVQITSATFTGANSADFRLVGQLVGTRLKPGQCISIELLFSPSGIGNRTATLEVSGNCGTHSIMILEGMGLAPCKWDAQANFDAGKIALNAATKTVTITGVICNTGPSNLKGTLTFPANPVLSITRGAGAFDLAPGACLDIDVSINPTTAGMHSITLDYGLAAECGVPNTIITAEVVEPKVTITDVAFGLHRVGTSVVDTIYIENQATQPATINSLTPQYPGDGNIVIDISGFSTPFDIQPGERVKVPVTFTPQARGPYTETLTAAVNGQATPLVGTVTGTGFLPSIGATGYNFQPVTVNTNSSEQGWVVITNTETSSPLVVNAVRFASPTLHFATISWPTDFPRTLQPGEELRLEVGFNPKAVGTLSVDVIIEHDAKPGPDPIPPYATTIVQVTGVGIDQSSIPPINFGNVLTCATATRTITITNPNPATPLQCDAPVVTGDAGVFTITPNTQFTIAPGGSQDVTVTFQPSAVGPASVTYSFANNQGLDLIVNATGVGITTTADFTLKAYGNINVGSTFPVSVMADIGDMQGVPVTSVDLTLTFDETYIGFKDLDVSRNQAGWTFTTDASVRGRLIITATSNTGATLVDGMFVEPRFISFLTADNSLPFSVSAIVTPTCAVPSGDSISIPVSQVCYSEGRLITFGATRFGMQVPSPNPASSHTRIEYSTGYTTPTTFELVSDMGAIVSVVTTPSAPSGTYELTLDTSTLGSGVYALRMISGHFITSQQLMIVR